MQGERVYLRLPEKSDRAEFIELARASRRFHRGLVKMAETPKEFEEFVKRGRKDDVASYLICLTDDDSIAGTITLSQIFYGPFRNAYLGYGLGEKFTRHGYMTEAVRLTLGVAFKKLGLHRVEANVQPQNKPSIDVLRKNGFTHEGYSRRYLKIGGRWRDHERWAILREDWSKGNR